MKHRKSPRHKTFDYANNATYFVTICTYHRIPYFWINKKYAQLSNIGIICKNEIIHMIQYRPYIIMHEYVIMPDHIHLLFTVNVGTGFCLSGMSNNLGTSTIPKKDNHKVVPTISLGSIVGNLKSAISRQCNKQYLHFQRQGRYHDHIIRNQIEFDKIKHYIMKNPTALLSPSQL